MSYLVRTYGIVFACDKCIHNIKKYFEKDLTNAEIYGILISESKRTISVHTKEDDMGRMKELWEDEEDFDDSDDEHLADLNPNDRDPDFDSD